MIKFQKLNGVFGFLGVIVLWSLLSYPSLLDPIFLPTPTKVFNAAVHLFRYENFLFDVGITTWRVMVGFALAALLAVPCGVAMATWKRFDYLFRPVAGFTRYLPVSAFIPLMILWLGIGFSQKVGIIFIGIFFHLAILCADDCLRVPREIIDSARVLGVDNIRLARKVIFPYSLPALFDDMRLMLGAAWTYLLLAELVAANSGIGNMMIQSQRFLKTDRVIAGILVVGVIGLLSDISFRYFGKLMMPWAKIENE